jgi:hypothetical protein
LLEVLGKTFNDVVLIGWTKTFDSLYYATDGLLLD